MTETKATKASEAAWEALVGALEAFDHQPGTFMAVAAAINGLIDTSVTEALERFADRVQEATGVRP